MKKTHFGFQSVDEEEKAHKVAGVFDSVARRYDVMNDVMSLGLHRLWKALTITRAAVRTGDKVLDIAGGTGDLAIAFAKRVGQEGQVWLTDINTSMLRLGRDRSLNRGYILPTLQCDAQHLPFPDHYFDVVTVAFGLRNMTHKDIALAEMRRVLKHGGKVCVLEFSKIWKPLSRIYDLYSFKVLPWLGKKIVDDEQSYRYLAESIRMHPGQEELKTMMEAAGFDHVEYTNLSAGVVALHIGAKY
jgi:demethylmenaquinone methyltransferase/2-methoxy-6-polyprenyl-1,4-benzoquinol methylase